MLRGVKKNELHEKKLHMKRELTGENEWVKGMVNRCEGGCLGRGARRGLWLSMVNGLDRRE